MVDVAAAVAKAPPQGTLKKAEARTVVVVVVVIVVVAVVNVADVTFVPKTTSESRRQGPQKTCSPF